LISFAFPLQSYYTYRWKILFYRKDAVLMDTTCKAAGLFPHPPIMIPEVGGKELAKMALTIDTEEKAMKRMVESGIETVVVISPHNLCFYDGPALFIADTISGSLSAFGHSEMDFFGAHGGGGGAAVAYVFLSPGSDPGVSAAAYD
jgi:hypothetical protein